MSRKGIVTLVTSAFPQASPQLARYPCSQSGELSPQTRILFLCESLLSILD